MGILVSTSIELGFEYNGYEWYPQTKGKEMEKKTLLERLQFLLCSQKYVELVEGKEDYAEFTIFQGAK